MKSIGVRAAPAEPSEDGSAAFSAEGGLDDELLVRGRRQPGRAPKFDADRLWAIVKPLYLSGFSVRDIVVGLRARGIELSRERVRLLIASRRRARKLKG